METWRLDFELKVDNCRFKTAELRAVPGEFVKINQSRMCRGTAMFWGEYKGKIYCWNEDQLKNFVI